MKNQKGITLVSLVITIIVLIILAGISINSLVGEQGIIIKAQQAKQNIQLAQSAEQENLNKLYKDLESVGGVGQEEDIIANLQTELSQVKADCSEYREKVAEAITNKGIETKSTDTADVVVDHINQLGEYVSKIDWEGNASICLTKVNTWTSSISIPTNGYKTIHLYNCWNNQSRI